MLTRHSLHLLGKVFNLMSGMVKNPYKYNTAYHRVLLEYQMCD